MVAPDDAGRAEQQPCPPQDTTGPMVGHQAAESPEQDYHQARSGGLVDIHPQQAHEHRDGQDPATAAEQPQGATQEQPDGGGEQDGGHQSV